MDSLAGKRRAIIAAAYAYLTLPVCIFFIGWLKPLISVPMTLVFLYGVVMAVRNFGTEKIKTPQITRRQVITVGLMIGIWVLLSGVGGFVWQNRYDHQFRNAVFIDLVDYDWPAVGASTGRMLTYYIGFWLPSALVGKVFGLEAGYVFQLIWAMIGVGLTFCLMGYVLKKFSWVTMLVFIIFSGWDVVPFIINVLSNGYPAPDAFFGNGLFPHIELEFSYFNSSSSTTLLFWVYNQTIPFWIGFLLILLLKDNKNLLFTYALLALYAPLPMIGALPAVAYRMLHNEGMLNKTFYRKIGSLLKNTLNVQNIAGVLQVGIVALFYMTNISASRVYTIMLVPYNILMFLFFFMVEFGIFLIWLSPTWLKNKLLLTMLASICVLNFIVVGGSFDFAWRTTIPFAFFLMLYVINKLIHKWHETRLISKMFIVLVLAVGFVTPGLEIARTVQNTAYIVIEKARPGTFEADSYQYTISQQPFRLNYMHGLVDLTDEDIAMLGTYKNFLGDATDDKFFNKYLRK